MKKAKRIIIVIILIIFIRFILFITGTLDIGPCFFFSRANKIMKEYLPEGFEYKGANTMVSKECLGIGKGVYDCKKIYRKSEWNDGDNNYNAWALFENNHGLISLVNLAVEKNIGSMENTMNKIENGDGNDFEIFVGDGYERIDGFFH